MIDRDWATASQEAEVKRKETWTRANIEFDLFLVIPGDWRRVEHFKQIMSA